MTSLISADDFGLTKSANRAIKSLLEKKMIQRVSIMANMDHFKSAIKIYKQQPNTDLGLHWNITEGKPVLLPNQIPSLVSKSGHFYSLGRLMLRTALGKTNQQDIYRELEAQYEKVSKHQLTITHLNSHQNIHAFPPFNHICIEFAKTHQIKTVRDQSSIKNRLRYLPIRLLIFNLIMIITECLFGKTKSWHALPELLIHPGTSYDPPAIRKCYST